MPASREHFSKEGGIAMMFRARFIVLLVVSLTGVVLSRHTLWEISSDCGLVFGGVSMPAPHLRRPVPSSYGN